MNAFITYKEISDFIENEFKIRPKFVAVDEKSVELSYKPGAFLPAIGVKLHIDAMRKDVVCLSYDCSLAASMLIAGVVGYLEEKIPSGIDVNTEDKRINIYPLRFGQLERVLEYLSLSDIHFGEDGVTVSLSLV